MINVTEVSPALLKNASNPWLPPSPVNSILTGSLNVISSVDEPISIEVISLNVSVSVSGIVIGVNVGNSRRPVQPAGPDIVVVSVNSTSTSNDGRLSSMFATNVQPLAIVTSVPTRISV